MHIYGIQKDGTDEPITEQQRRHNVENRFIHMGWGEEGEGGTSGEDSMETYALPFVKWMCKLANGNLL